MIHIDMDKARKIGHEIRRAKRAAEFAPLDVKATIPAEAASAESDRQAVREKYAAVQEQIDAATAPDDIKAALGL